MTSRFGVAALALLAFANNALACAPAPMPHDHVYVVEESALVVWDASTRTEHFIRRAMFDGSGKNFGFLVPTPSAPQLAEAPDSLFETLEQTIAPKVVVRKEVRVSFVPLVGVFTNKGDGMNNVVTTAIVISRQHVAGYDTAVLKASDPRELSDWLAKNGYDFSPALNDWLAAYTRAGWFITAFKVAAPDAQAQTTAVRMSFTTDAPFFPYREPATQRDSEAQKNQPSRMLRVWFAGNERVDGTIGATKPWSATVPWSNRLEEAAATSIKREAGVALPSAAWLTAYIDTSSPRPGTDDLFFHRAASQQPVVPPPLVQIDETVIPIPIDVVAVIAVAVLLFAWRRRLRRRRVEL